jgi:hypothetical protein
MKLIKIRVSARTGTDADAWFNYDRDELNKLPFPSFCSLLFVLGQLMPTFVPKCLWPKCLVEFM